MFAYVKIKSMLIKGISHEKNVCFSLIFVASRLQP